jgi:hypothetical protein
MQGEIEKQNGVKRFIALAVPFAKKDHFKLKYGRQFLWDARRKTWFWLSQDELPQDLIPFLPPPQASSEAGPRLFIELVPRTCWLSNVRNHVTEEQWNTIRKHTFRTARYVCQICGGRGDKWPVECHELFAYDDSTCTQKLLSFQALCPCCHRVKHFGMTQVKGLEAEAFTQLCKVNEWTDEQARRHVSEQFALWHQRSEKEWSIDLSYLETHFDIVIQPESTEQRRDRAEAFYRQTLAEHQGR